MGKGAVGGEKDGTGLDLLTMFERRFLAAYVETGTLTAAARKLRKFPSKQAAASAAWRYWQQIKKKVDVEMLMESVGLSRVRIFRALNAGLNAKAVRPFLSRKTGKIVEAGPYADHPTRVKAAAEAAKIAGLTIDRHVVADPDGKPLGYGATEAAVRVAALLDQARKRAKK